MFRELSERITIWGINRKWLDIEKRRIYEYGLEVILLNVSILLICLMVSLLQGTMLFFGMLVMVFIPLRTSVGGIHASKCEICFGSSILLYCVLMELSGAAYRWGHSWLWGISFMAAVVFLWIVAPVKNKKRTYEMTGIKEKRKKAHGILVGNVVLFIVAYLYMPRIACYQVIQILGVCMIAVLGLTERVEKVE